MGQLREVDRQLDGGPHELVGIGISGSLGAEMSAIEIETCSDFGCSEIDLLQSDTAGDLKEFGSNLRRMGLLMNHDIVPMEFDWRHALMPPMGSTSCYNKIVTLVEQSCT